MDQISWGIELSMVVEMLLRPLFRIKSLAHLDLYFLYAALHPDGIFIMGDSMAAVRQLQRDITKHQEAAPVIGQLYSL